MEPDHLREDLKQEVILIICELSEEKLHQLHNDKALEFFTVRVILNQIKSNTSPFSKKYRQLHSEFSDKTDPELLLNRKYGEDFTVTDVNNFEKWHRHTTVHDIKPEERRLRECIEDIAVSEINNLYWFDKEMLQIYVKCGSFRAMEELTKIPHVTCYHNIKKTLSTLKKRALHKGSEIFSKDELDFIQNGTKQKRQVA